MLVYVDQSTYTNTRLVVHVDQSTCTNIIFWYMYERCFFHDNAQFEEEVVVVVCTLLRAARSLAANLAKL